VGDEAQSVDSDLIALTPIDPITSPVLDRISMERSVIHADAFESLDALRDHLRSGDIIALDLAQLDQAQVDNYRAFLTVAQAIGLGIVMENVHSEDMARLIGIGVDGAAVLVRPMPGSDRTEVKVYDGPENVMKVEPSYVETSWQKTEQFDAYMAMNNDERAAFAIKLGMDEATLAAIAEQVLAGEQPVDLGVENTDMEEIVVRPELSTTEEIVVDIVKNLPTPRVMNFNLIEGTDTLPAKKYWDYYLNRPTLSYSATDSNKTASVDADVDVQLMALSQPGAKFLALSSAGAGATPGGLTWNNGGSATKDGRRGWYQESIQYTLTPTSVGGGTGNLANYKHAPSGTNSSGSFAATTGCGVEGSASPSFNCSTSNTVTQSLMDFGVVDLSAGLINEWRFRMTQSSGGSYTSWGNLVNNKWGGLHAVPTLAHSTINPEYQAIYRAAKTYTGVVTIESKFNHQLRDVRTDAKVFVQKSYMRGYAVPNTRNITINFGSVTY
jgi:hypothetical protein